MPTGKSIFGKRHLDIAFLREWRPRMEVHERNLIRTGWTESWTQQRHACAIGAVHGLGRLARHVHRDHRCAWRERDLEKRLRAILHRQHDFSQRAALARDERRRHGAIGDGGEHAGVREPLDLEGERGSCAGGALIAKCREHGQPRERLQRAD